jgi:HK97 family phage major capsid protein
VREAVKTKTEVLARAQSILAEKPFSKMAEAEFNSLMRLHDAMSEVQPETRSRDAAAELRAQAEVRVKTEAADQEFRHYTRSIETRSYTALNTGVGAQGGYLIPDAWRKEYQSRLVSASGFLKAGVTILDSENAYGRPWLHFFSDDSANQAEILPENTALTSTPNPVASVKTPPVVTFASGSLVSGELTSDIAFDLDGYLQSLFAVRVARKFNNWASVDATNGLVPQLTVSATTASATLPTIVELTNMQTAIDYAYREDGAAYMLSPAMETLLKQQVGTSGNRVYPEMNDGKLLGYDYHVNVDLLYAPANVGVIFGSFKRLAIVQNVRPILLKSIERFAEFNQRFYVFFHRLGIKLVDQNAATALKLHA